MLSSLTLPFFRELNTGNHILLAGAGGGFDFFSALPLFYALRDAGKTVSLANLSFSTLTSSMGRQISPACVEITAASDGSRVYFPEMHLATYFQNEGHATPIYALHRTGYK